MASPAVRGAVQFVDAVRVETIRRAVQKTHLQALSVDAPGLQTLEIKSNAALKTITGNWDNLTLGNLLLNNNNQLTAVTVRTARLFAQSGVQIKANPNIKTALQRQLCAGPFLGHVAAVAFHIPGF